MNELVSISQAASLRGVTHAAIQDLIRRGRLKAKEIGGRKFLRKGDVLNFTQAHKGGRGHKAGN